MNLIGQLETYLVLAAALLCIGIYGFIRRQTLIGMLISAEIIFAAATLNIMAMNRFVVEDPVQGQVFALFILGLAAAEAAVALSLFIAVYRNYKSVATNKISELHG